MKIDFKKYFARFVPRPSNIPKEPCRTSSSTIQAEQATSIAPLASRRSDDMSAEAQLARFLDQYLYNEFPNKDAFVSIERVRTKELQVSGVDVLFTAKDGRVFNVDEKAQLYYLNKDLPTFAFEISYLRGERVATGWLCNTALKTDLYMLIWPHATQDTPKGIRWSQFTKAECLLVERKKLLEMLERQGLSLKKISDQANAIRAAGKTGRIPIHDIPGIYYYASDPSRYKEAPINIVITKERLSSIAQRRYIVTTSAVISK